jgi:uncharacterized membrane protein
MNSSKLITLAVLAVLLLSAASALGQVSIEWIGSGAPTAISADGSVVAGNTNGTYETFRWTADTGIEPLGMCSVCVLGSGAGGPDISADGRFISASILGQDSTYVTPGRWSEEFGWEECMPPGPPDGSPLSDAYGSAWGISGDGSTVVGLYWLGGGAKGFAWNPTDGPMGMGSTVGNSRINDANFDGSVMVGWDEAPFGTWLPTVWENGTITHLTETESFCLANAVTPDGNMIGGSSSEGTGVRQAAIWIRNGDTWDENLLGTLPGTVNPFGQAIVNGISADGTIIVGYNAYNPGSSAGFIYTLQDGMMDIADLLSDAGVSVPPGWTISSLTGVSADGKHICGIATQTVFPWGNEGFVIHLNDVAAVPEAAVAFQLEPSFPNPFNPRTTIPVVMSRDGGAQLEIFDTAGRRMRTLHSGMLSAGRHEFIWNGRDENAKRVSSGVYFSRLTDDTGASLKRSMVLVK